MMNLGRNFHKIILILLVIFLSAAFLSPLLSHTFYESHDGEAHLARFAAYTKAFQDGQFPPRWAGDLNFGYGTPVFIFYYPLPGYLASLMHFGGMSFEMIFKLLMIAGFLLAPICFYLWAKLLFKKEVAVIGALLYGLAPYHFLDLYVRGDIAEVLAFIFVPLVFWAIEKTVTEKKNMFIIWGGIFYGLLILSHNGVSLMFSPVFLLYGIIRSKNKKLFASIVVLFFIGLVLSAFFWMPALYEGRYVNTKLFIGNMYKDNFPTVLQLIISRWGFGADVAKANGLSPQLGLIPFGFAVAACSLFFKEKKKRKIFGMWLGVFAAAVFITLPISNSVWSHISLLRLYEFPWRFVGLVSFAAAVLACFVLEKIHNKKIFIVLLLAILITSLPLVRVKKYISESDAYYAHFAGTTDYHGAATSIWTAGEPNTFAKHQIELIGGQGKIDVVEKKSVGHVLAAHAKNEVAV